MSTPISLPVGFWSLPDPRASGRSTLNCFAEVSPYGGAQLTAAMDGKQKLPPALLRRAPGVTQFATDGTSNAVRGAREMLGVWYVVIGPTLYSLTSSGLLSEIGTGILGTGLVRMADNTACLTILVPGTANAWTYCPNGPGFELLTAAGFTQYGAIDVWYVDTYTCFLATNGRTMFSDDGQEASGQGQITFNTGSAFARELGTDLWVGFGVANRQLFMAGERTSEALGNAGNQLGSPFASSPAPFVELGMHPLGAYTIALLCPSSAPLGGLCFVTNDYRVMFRQTNSLPQRVSNHAVETLLASSSLTGCYAMPIDFCGHTFYVLTLPAQQLTLAYDFTTGEWCKLSSLIGGVWSYWRPTCSFKAFGQQYVGDSQGSGIGQLTETTYTEYGNPIKTEWTTQSIYDSHNRISHRRVEAVVTAGQSTSLTAGANITCYVSDDSGQTYHALPLRNLGVDGAYTARAYWMNVGLSRDRTYKFQISDPTPVFAVDMPAELQGGRW